MKLLIPVFITLQDDNKYKAWMEQPIVVKRVSGLTTRELLAEKTQELAAVFEKNIRKHPDQWYQFFDYWSRYGSEDTSS
jgi:predicted LPLAT superfamily acyltransferase